MSFSAGGGLWKDHGKSAAPARRAFYRYIPARKQHDPLCYGKTQSVAAHALGVFALVIFIENVRERLFVHAGAVVSDGNHIAGIRNRGADGYGAVRAPVFYGV